MITRLLHRWRVIPSVHLVCNGCGRSTDLGVHRGRRRVHLAHDWDCPAAFGTFWTVRVVWS